MQQPSRSGPRAHGRRHELPPGILLVILATSLLVPLLISPAVAQRRARSYAFSNSRDLVRVESPATNNTVTALPVNVTLAFGDRADPASLRVWLNGTQITSAFGTLQDGRRSAALTFDRPLSFDRNRLVVTVARERSHGHGHGRFDRWHFGRVDVEVVPFSLTLEQIDDPSPDPRPRIPVNTRVGPDLEGSVAVQVDGRDFDMPELSFDTINACPANTAVRGVWILQLNRKTLQRAGDRQYPTCRPDQIAAMKADLATVPTTDLVVVNTFIAGRDLSTFLPAPLQLGDALSVVGTTNELGLTASINEITMSAVGVAGMAPGEAFQRVAPYTTDACGPKGSDDCLTGANMSGWFVLDTHANYTFEPMAHVDFDVRASTDPRGNTIRVGTAKYVAPPLPPDAKGGFQVLVLNRTTLEPMQCGTPAAVCNATFATNADDTGNLVGNITALANRISDYHESNGELVFVVSMGEPLPLSNGGNSQLVRLALAHAIESIGGTYDTIIDTTTQPYALVGSGLDRVIDGTPLVGVEPVSEVEASSFITPYAEGPEAKAARLTGVLERGRQWLWTPGIRSLAPDTSYLMYQILERPAVAFPTFDDDDEVQAQAWITMQLCNCQDFFDIRTQYDDDNIPWTERYTTLNALPYPQGKGFDETAFTKVKDQYLKEFDYLAFLATLFSNLNGLADNSESSLQELVRSTAAEVGALVPTAQDDSEAEYGAVDAIEALGEVAMIVGGEEFEPLAEPISLLGSLLDMGIAFSATGEGRPYDEIGAKESELETEVIASFDGALHALATAQDMIAGDWGKLSTVGASLKSAQAGSPWYWDRKTMRPATLDALRISVRRHYHEALLPLVESIVAIPNAKTADPATFCYTPPGFDVYCPFRGYPGHAYIEAPRTGDPLLELRLMARLPSRTDVGLPASGSPIDDPTPPPPSLMNTLTGEPADPLTGPLGIYKPWIFRHWDFPGWSCDGQAGNEVPIPKCTRLAKTTP